MGNELNVTLLRERVALLIGQAVEKMGNAQWIEHLVKRLHLIGESEGII